ncbi:hypothetical protein H6504_00370 [Candidatus Woesearchaeota archaeon]|nr:hypothetical protein [Candidatus Woesearchaeota archaeon]
MIRKIVTICLVLILASIALSGCTEPKQYQKANVDLSGSDSPTDTLPEEDVADDMLMREEPEKTEEDKFEEQLSTILEDGSYSEEFTYAQPKGMNRASLDFTIEDGVITEFFVEEIEAEDISKRKIKAFNEGVGEYVLGKSIEEVELPTVVSGSSLTTAAVAEKLDEIKAN